MHLSLHASVFWLTLEIGLVSCKLLSTLYAYADRRRRRDVALSRSGGPVVRISLRTTRSDGRTLVWTEARRGRMDSCRSGVLSIRSMADSSRMDRVQSRALRTLKYLSRFHP